MSRLDKIKRLLEKFPADGDSLLGLLAWAVGEIERLERGIQVPVPGDQDMVPNTTLYAYMIGLGMPEALSSEQQAEWLRSVLCVGTAVRARLAGENDRLRAALAPFTALGKTIYQSYQGTVDHDLGTLPTLDEWRKAAEASP